MIPGFFEIPGYITKALAEEVGKTNVKDLTVEDLATIDQIIIEKVRNIKSVYKIDVNFWTEDMGEEYVLSSKQILTNEKIVDMYTRLNAIEVIENRISRYPPDILKEHVSQIVVSNKIRVKNNPEFPYIGMSDYKKKTVWMGTLEVKKNGEVFEPWLFDHEIGHMILTERKVSRFDWIFNVYSSLLIGEPKYTHPTTDDVRREGFIRGYSRYSYFEDMATVLEHLYSFEDIEYMSSMDKKIIETKLAFVKKQYNNILKLPSDYWPSLSAGKIDIEYWKKHKRI